MIRVLVLMMLFFSCQEPMSIPDKLSMTLGECLETYKLDGSSFGEETHLVVNVTVHELLEDSMRYPMHIYDSLVSKLSNTYELANISYRLKAVNCCRTMPYMTVTSISKYAAFNNDKNSLNLYILPDDTLDYRGAAVGIPSTTCAIQRAWIGTSTACHEFGHMQGLKHIHEPDKTDGYNIIYGDQICDTPSPDDTGLPLTECFKKLLHKTDAESTIILNNIMSYSYYICRTNITLVQAARIRLAYEMNNELKATIYRKI